MNPTISLALIAKNEEKNIDRLLDSVEGCFTEIILVDTGSTDKTKEIAEKRGCKVYDFEWVNSFSKARNFAFSKCSKDYIMWLDLDDVLSDKNAFIKWRDTAMQFNGVWFATYHYALDEALKPIISFVRERVFRRSLEPKWQYDLHEGVIARPEWQPSYITTWAVNHMRDIEDIKADKSRNIKILEEIKDRDARLKFYYGKELYEANRPQEALLAFDVALKDEKLEPHDKLLTYQYAAYSAMASFDQIKDEYREEKQKIAEKAIDYCMRGIKEDPNRAEFHCAMGDMYLKRQMLPKALPCFSAAKACLRQNSGESKYEGAIYSFVNCYGEIPSLQLAKIYLHLGLIEKSKKEANECIEFYKNSEAKDVLKEVERIEKLINLDNGQKETSDIVITCPPQSAYEFDEDLYKKKGMGGSETALIEVAKHLKKKTGRAVKVFAMRKEKLVGESGVEYIPNTQMGEYLSENRPYVNVAWRHNIRVTNARTYLWCHDLVTPTVESKHNFDKILCLSRFHKDYVQAMQGVPDEKVIVTRNGLSPEKFKFEKKQKNPNKIVWMSSPDRGLDRSMIVLDQVRRDYPDLELHVYYGLENLYKYGMAGLAEHLKKMMSDRPWVKYHGFTEQSKMYHDVSDAVLWLHPCNFIETYCITANEMLALGIFPVTRKLGALANTLEDAESKGHATLLDHDCISEVQIERYAESVREVLSKKLWEKIEFDVEKHSWESIADEWIKFMEL